jgi:hypothetical protein
MIHLFMSCQREADDANICRRERRLTMVKEKGTDAWMHGCMVEKLFTLSLSPLASHLSSSLLSPYR